MLLALALQAALSSTPSAPPPAADMFGERAFAHFSREALLANLHETVDIATATDPHAASSIAYTVRLTRRQASHPATVVWADSRTCAAVRPVLAAMRAMTLPHPSVLGIDPPGAIVVDGTEYRLRTEAGYAHARHAWIDIGSNRNTPLAAWVDRSLAALARCWSSRPPEG